MHDARVVEAYCATCADVRPHRVETSDPGSCTCSACGATQQMMVPLA